MDYQKLQDGTKHIPTPIYLPLSHMRFTLQVQAPGIEEYQLA